MGSLLELFSNKKRITLLGIFLLVNLILFYIPGFPGSIPEIKQQHSKLSIPDMKISFDANETYQFLSRVGQDGRNAYQLLHLGTDLVFPILTALFIFSVISKYVLMTQKKSGNNFSARYLPLLAFIPACFDYGENFILIYLTEKFPKRLMTLTSITQIATLGKFVFLFINFIVISYLVIKVHFSQEKRIH